ncbi:MAG: hypothetical protein QHI48_09780, partial [Bacteroidota bacterium]|nr:hypothetical protein [Bacteroidota bacterium]
MGHTHDRLVPICFEHGGELDSPRLSPPIAERRIVRSPFACLGIAVCFSLLVLAVGVNAQARRQTVAERGFEKRCAFILSVYDTAASPGILGAALRYARGRDLRRADSLFLNSDHLRNPRGDMFWMFPVIGTYLHGKGKMSAEVERAVRRAWKTYWPYRGDTE